MHEDLPPVSELPWTINYVIRKRAQLDSYNELPRDKVPPDTMIWYGKPEDLEEWFDKVLYNNDEDYDKAVFEIEESEIG